MGFPPVRPCRCRGDHMNVTHHWKADGARIVDERWTCNDHMVDLVCPAETDTAKISDAILNTAADHPMWIGDDGEPLDYSPAREALIGDFVDTATRAVRQALAGA